MFQRLDTTKKDSFLDKAKQARDSRAEDKRRQSAALQIQALVRGHLTRKRFYKDVRQDIDAMLEIGNVDGNDYSPTLKPASELFKTINKLFVIFNEKHDKKRFEYTCKYVLLGMGASSTKPMYSSLALSKQHVVPWITQVKKLLCTASNYLKSLQPEIVEDKRVISTCLAVLVTLTSCQHWKLFSFLGATGEALRPGIEKICDNVMGHLVAQGLYPNVQSLLHHGLARSRPCLTATTLTGALTLALRPLVASSFSDHLLSAFLLHVLSVPAVIHHLGIHAMDCTIKLMEERLFSRSIALLSNEQSTRIIFNALEGNYALSLLANLIDLGRSEMEGIVEGTDRFVVVVTRLLLHCKQYVDQKKSHMTHWHPVLGWFSQTTDQGYHDAMPLVVRQLQVLWKFTMISIVFEPALSYTELCARQEGGKNKTERASSKNPLKKALEKASSRPATSRLKLDSPVLTQTCRACTMYLTAMHTLSQLNMDIMAGLCHKDAPLRSLWRLLYDLGPDCGLKTFLDVLATANRPDPPLHPHPILDLLQLTCDTTSHIIAILDDVELFEQHKPLPPASLVNISAFLNSILDDVELYEQHKPLPPASLVNISAFLNSFVFRAVWTGLIDVEKASRRRAADNDVLYSAHALLMLLYERDCRKQFTLSENHWLIRDAKPSVFLAELEKGNKAAKYLMQITPHIIPHKERVVLLRRMVEREKESLGLRTDCAHASPHSTLITVHRARLIEDGYRQLAAQPPAALKGIIRVKFVNQQGLDEAGIDQDGVFKEFLEETIKRVFDPSLNLFKVTEEQKLYPSPTSHVHEDHLALFDFVGRMLGKAVYEGIVVEVPFAPFFLSQMRGHQHNAIYSAMDELPSLDATLYRSLTYIKHYDGDMSDLELTFSTDEDVLGRIVTHELRAGGRLMPVTDENKIAYIHLMAHFKLRTQIREQTAAFLRGFQSLVPRDWLAMFSGPELQKLISGDTADIDLADLRRHTQYYGGFHNGHKVVNWLWDVLQNDFNADERSAFLKFVTSCSKPPLLGFAHLEPPFSIRCVEVSEDQDTGDTLGSVLKGFLHLGKRDPVGRLPTSSTCFNLLKLPNYQKKATLRDKMRYAISSNTGFELS